MRIISGKYKGRIIRMPRGIRPTQNKVRKALFDILGDIEGLSFLELFAGSGAVGIEALSRGAQEGVFVEEDSKCTRIIKENLLLLGCLSVNSARHKSLAGGFANVRHKDRRTRKRLVAGIVADVIALDAHKAIESLCKNRKKFDIIFFDPPYHRDLTKKTLLNLSTYDILSPNGFIVAQHFKKDILPDRIGNLIILRQAEYGDTVLSFYKKDIRKLGD